MKSLLAALLMLGVAASMAGAQTAIPKAATTQSFAKKTGSIGVNSNQPIDIAADKVAADLNSKTVTYSGNVVVTQGDIKMHADAMKVNTDNGKASTIQATGKVVVDSPVSGTVTGDNGVYDVSAHSVLMTGKVVLTHGKDVMRGTRLTVNLVTGQAVLGAPGTGTQAAPTGRVQGTFTPGNGN